MFPRLTRLFIFASVLLLMLAAGLYFAGIRAEKGPGSPVNLTQNRVLRLLEKAETDATEIKARLKEDNLFSLDLFRNIETSSFLYKGKELVIWTDHHIQPDQELVRLAPGIRAVEMRTGKFLVQNSRPDSQYVLVQYIPLERTYPVRNAFFASGLNDEIFRGISATISLEKSHTKPGIHTAEGAFLFALSDVSTLGSGPLLTASVLCLLGAMLALVLWLQFVAFSLYKKRLWLKGMVVALFPAIFLRALAIWLNFPFSFADIGFFNPRIYAASVWSQSVGDLLLTLLVAGLVALHIWYFSSSYKRHVAGGSKKVPATAKLLIGSLLYLGAVFLLYDLYQSLLANSRVELDITQSLKISVNRAGLMAACVLFTGTFFLVAQLLMNWLIPLAANLSGKQVAIIFGCVLLLALPCWWLGYPELIIVLIAGLCYPLFSLFFKNRKNLAGETFHLYLRLFVAASISAAIGATAFYMHQKQRDLHQKEQIAGNLLLKNDLLSEYLLHEAGQKIAEDPMIRRQLMNPVVPIDLIRQKIMRQYVGSHFNAYDPKVIIFGANGFSASSAGLDSALTMQNYRQRVAPGTEQTNYQGLYLKIGQSSRQSRTYIQFIELKEGQGLIATIVLELSLKRMPSHSVLPQLLVDQRFSQTNLEKGYSYAIFQNGQLQATGGDFDYRAFFGDQLTSQSGLLQRNLNRSGFTHFEFRNDENLVVVVSSRAYLFENSLANFSFLLLIYTASILVAIVLYAALRPELRLKLWSSLSAKIQVLLSLGLMVPMAVISLAIIGQITKAYQEDVRLSYNEKGEIIRAQLSTYVLNDTLLMPKEQMREAISDLALLSDAEIHLFDKNGNLVLATQPLLFETGLLSQHINPTAFTLMALRGRQRLLLEETTGRWSFNVLYMPVLSGSDQLAGFVALPFYDSEKELETRINRLVTTVMSIFTLIFLISGLLTFIASQAVVKPLQMLTEKIRRVTLSKKNEPIYYAVNDELGLLVREYNEMLQKLEESKRELAEKEKEQAWREMARQVAHEIKNPLTPMKLSMQYLKHALASGQGNINELVNRTANTVITQIDVLSDIATSFSHFTSMPEPKKELVSVNSVIRRTADLHNDPEKGTVLAELPETDLKVIGDDDLLVRIFNNLVINALQAIPAGITPGVLLKAELTEDKKQILAQVQDNGTGIPEELHERVFVPNFSTKYAGSGIGLAVAKKGIEQMGGRIWFVTAVNKGTTFYIQLPVAD